MRTKDDMQKVYEYIIWLGGTRMQDSVLQRDKMQFFECTQIMICPAHPSEQPKLCGYCSTMVEEAVRSNERRLNIYQLQVSKLLL